MAKKRLSFTIKKHLKILPLIINNNFKKTKDILKKKKVIAKKVKEI